MTVVPDDPEPPERAGESAVWAAFAAAEREAERAFAPLLARLDALEARAAGPEPRAANPA